MSNLSQFQSSKIKAIILPVFLIIVGLLLWQECQEVYENSLPKVAESWNFSEWMINYTGGFVRRGLAGQILIQAYQSFRIDFTVTVIVFNTIIYLCVFTYFSFRAWKLSRKLWTLLFLILNPSLILFPILDGSLFRKDLIPILITMIHVLLIERLLNQRKDINSKPPSYSPRAFFLIGIPATILSLIHETISLTIFMPLNVFLSISYLVTVEKTLHQPLVRKATAIYFAGVLACIISTIAKGNGYIAKSICMSWQDIIPGVNCNESIPPAVDALGWSFRYAIGYSYSVINSGAFLLYLLILIFMMIIAIPALANLQQQEINDENNLVNQRQSLILHLYLVSLFFSIPLYILGWDWGRYFFIISMQVGIVVLSPVTFSALLNFYKTYLINLQSFKIGHLKTSQTRLLAIKNLSIHIYVNVFKGIKRFLPLVENNRTTTLFFLLVCGLPHCCITVSRVFETSFSIQLFRVTKTFLSSF